MRGGEELTLTLQFLHQRLAKQRGRVRNRDPCALHGVDLGFRAALAAGDDGPAWPMRRPGGAVRPAMKPAMGFFFFDFAMNSAASSSAEPPISPIMMIDSVASSARKHFQHVDEFGALHGSPPMPTAVVWPKPSCVVWNTAS